MAEKRNESGKKITKKMKEKQDSKKSSIYKNWMSKTHLKIPKSGEIEDAKTMDQGKRASEARKVMKEHKLRHGSDLFKGTDAKSNQHIIEQKKKKLQEKMRVNSKKNKKQGGGARHSEKAKAKMNA